MAAQIGTGIGFLGAGVIVKEGLRPFGLNTAATLWAAAVAALCGVWMWREAVVGAVIIVASNGLFIRWRSGLTADLTSPAVRNRPTFDTLRQDGAFHRVTGVRVERRFPQ